MIEILQNYDLTKINSFGVSASARFFAVVRNEEELQELFSMKEFQKNSKLFFRSSSSFLARECTFTTESGIRSSVSSVA